MPAARNGGQQVETVTIMVRPILNNAGIGYWRADEQKCRKAKDGDGPYALNEACSAGCGGF